MTEDEEEADKILNAGVDFEFALAYEVIPAIEIKDVCGIKVTRKGDEITRRRSRRRSGASPKSARSDETKDGRSADGDRLTIDFVGKIDGEPSTAARKATRACAGLQRVHPGIRRAAHWRAGWRRKVVDVTFPADYAAQPGRQGRDLRCHRQGSVAPGEVEINDEIATSLGLESPERLKEIVRGQIESQFGSMTRQKVKRELLDPLDAPYQFEAPSSLVDAEFENIWRQVNRDLETAGSVCR